MKRKRIAIISALLLTAVPVFAQNTNTAVTNLEWVDAGGGPLAETQIFDTVYASADAANIPDGTKVSVIIFEYNEDEGLPDDYVTKLKAAVQGGAIRAAWKVIYDEEQTNTRCVREIKDRGWTIPRYRFRVQYAADGETFRSTFSAPLTAWDSVTVQLGKGDPFTRFILRLADGTKRKVVADDEGRLRAFRLPLGLVELMVDTTYFTDDESF